MQLKYFCVPLVIALAAPAQAAPPSDSSNREQVICMAIWHYVCPLSPDDPCYCGDHRPPSERPVPREKPWPVPEPKPDPRPKPNPEPRPKPCTSVARPYAPNGGSPCIPTVDPCWTADKLHYPPAKKACVPTERPAIPAAKPKPDPEPGYPKPNPKPNCVVADGGSIVTLPSACRK